MLVIRLQRVGRKGHAQFRVVVQDSRRTPTSGKIVALLGNFNPHTKTANLDKEKASFYLEHGAQPSDRVVRLLKSEGVKLPKWVEVEGKKNKSTKNVEKLRRNRPADTEAPAKEEAPEAESKAESEGKPVETEEVKAEEAEEKAPVEAPEESETEATTEKVAEAEELAEEPKTDEDKA